MQARAAGVTCEALRGRGAVAAYVSGCEHARSGRGLRKEAFRGREKKTKSGGRRKKKGGSQPKVPPNLQLEHSVQPTYAGHLQKTYLCLERCLADGQILNFSSLFF